MPRSVEFTPTTIRLCLDEEERGNINSYLYELIDNYNFDFTIHQIESEKSDSDRAQLIKDIAGFVLESYDYDEAAPLTYKRKGQLIGWTEFFPDIPGFKKGVAIIDSEGNEAGGELTFGAVDRKTGKAILIFSKEYFEGSTESDHEESGIWQDFGFIYDPLSPSAELGCIVMQGSEKGTSRDNNLEYILETLSNELIASEQARK